MGFYRLLTNEMALRASIWGLTYWYADKLKHQIRYLMSQNSPCYLPKSQFQRYPNALLMAINCPLPNNAIANCPDQVRNRSNVQQNGPDNLPK